MRHGLPAAMSGVLVAVFGSSPSAAWDGVDRKYGNEAGCAFQYGTPSDEAVVLEPGQVIGGGRICEIMSIDGNEDFAYLLVNCDSYHSTWRRYFGVEKAGAAAWLVYGNNPKDEWQLLGKAEPCS